jgi:hypothetical protein
LFQKIAAGASGLIVTTTVGQNSPGRPPFLHDQQARNGGVATGASPWVLGERLEA